MYISYIYKYMIYLFIYIYMSRYPMSLYINMATPILYKYGHSHAALCGHFLSYKSSRHTYYAVPYVLSTQ